MDALHQNLDFEQNFDTLLYRVKPADTLSKILQQYHPSLQGSQLQELVEQVVQDNPAIKNPNHIVPDQLVRLRIPQQYCSAPRLHQEPLTVRTDDHSWLPAIEREWQYAPKKDRDFMSILLPVMIGAGSAKASMIETTFKTNTPLLSEMIENYESYKLQRKTKGQYDYKRAQIIERFTNKLGPTNLILNGKQPPTEVLRISRTKGTTPTKSIQGEISKMKLVSTLAKSGGVALSVVGLGLACNEIGAARTLQKKNEILIESTGGLAGGIVYGLGTSVVIAFMATPVGWVAALVIGVGSVAVGYGAGKGLRTLYDKYGNRIDFATAAGVTKACGPEATLSYRKGPKGLISNQTLSVL